MIDVQDAPTLPPETVTPIKPSEAIRLGCLTTKQAFGTLADATGAVCALGAMMIGFGAQPGEEMPEPYEAFRLGPLLEVPGRLYSRRPGVAVVVLNDSYRWSRERIADWLEAQGL